MRSIHFKGIHMNRWVFGDLIHKNGAPFIGLIDQHIYQVAEETVCEFTGVLDFTKWDELPENERSELMQTYHEKAVDANISIDSFWKGIPIYENDILECENLFDSNIKFRGVVKHNKGGFGVEFQNPNGMQFIPLQDLIEFSYKSVGSIFQIVNQNT